MSRQLGVHAMTVGKWRRRFLAQRVEGLRDELRPGTPRTIEDARVEAVITRTDVVGLYVAPPEHALVLCVDEKSQIQALDRSQPVFPMRPGQSERRSHDYARHGTTSLFAALDIATGQVIGQCYPRHRATEFRHFLDEIEARVPHDLDVHLIWDNYATHKTALIRNWLAKRRRWHVHLTPTSSSCLNQVERFFALLTEKPIRRGVHRSVAELEAAITAFLDKHNAEPKAFRWVKSADDILAAIERFCIYNTTSI